MESKKYTFPLEVFDTPLVFVLVLFAALPCYLVVLCSLSGVFPTVLSLCLDQPAHLTGLRVTVSAKNQKALEKLDMPRICFKFLKITEDCERTKMVRDGKKDQSRDTRREEGPRYVNRCKQSLFYLWSQNCRYSALCLFTCPSISYMHYAVYCSLPLATPSVRWR